MNDKILAGIESEAIKNWNSDESIHEDYSGIDEYVECMQQNAIDNLVSYK